MRKKNFARRWHLKSGGVGDFPNLFQESPLFVIPPAEKDFNHHHRKKNKQDGSANHSKRDPRQSVVIPRFAGVFSIISFQKKSKVCEVTGLTAQKILSFGLTSGCVIPNSGEAIIFASPVIFALVIIAQAHPLILLCVVGKR